MPLAKARPRIRRDRHGKVARNDRLHARQPEPCRAARARPAHRADGVGIGAAASGAAGGPGAAAAAAAGGGRSAADYGGAGAAERRPIARAVVGGIVVRAAVDAGTILGIGPGVLVRAAVVCRALIGGGIVRSGIVRHGIGCLVGTAGVGARIVGGAGLVFGP